MEVRKDNWEDVKKYFHQTYVKISSEGERVWYVQEVGPSYIVVKCNNPAEEAQISYDFPFSFDYVLPHKTTFQYQNRAMILSRIPAQQWKKGLNKLNTQFETLNREGVWGNHPFSLEAIEGYVNKPGYFTFQEALDLLSKGAAESCALNPRMSLSGSGSLFVDTTLVGKYDQVKKQLVIKSLFENEARALHSFANLRVLK